MPEISQRKPMPDFCIPKRKKFFFSIKFVTTRIGFWFNVPVLKYGEKGSVIDNNVCTFGQIKCYNISTLVFLWHRNCLPSGTSFSGLSEGFFRSERMIFFRPYPHCKNHAQKTKVETLYTDPILVFFGTEIAYAPKQFFSARLRGFSGQKRMFFHFQHVRQKSCQRKPKLDQYSRINDLHMNIRTEIFCLDFFVSPGLCMTGGFAQNYVFCTAGCLPDFLLIPARPIRPVPRRIMVAGSGVGVARNPRVSPL